VTVQVSSVMREKLTSGVGPPGAPGGDISRGMVTRHYIQEGISPERWSHDIASRRGYLQRDGHTTLHPGGDKSRGMVTRHCIQEGISPEGWSHDITSRRRYLPRDGHMTLHPGAISPEEWSHDITSRRGYLPRDGHTILHAFVLVGTDSSALVLLNWTHAGFRCWL
jgi:hypothetical protein